MCLLSGLTYLDLFRSELQSTILANISNCTKLQYLSLEQNQVFGEIPSLHGLVHLSVLGGGTSFTGLFSKGLSGVGSLLRIVALSDNELGGPSPPFRASKSCGAEARPLHRVRRAAILQYKWSAAPDRLGKSSGRCDSNNTTSLRNLRVLNMSRNRVSGIPSGFSRLWNSSLRSVDLSQNNLSGNIPADFLVPPLNYTIYINLSHDLLSGNVKLNDTLFQVFSVVDLSYNQFSKPRPLILSGNDRGIRSLWLDNNQFSGDIVDVLIQAASRAFYLSTVELYLFNNRLTGNLSRMVGKWANLSLEVTDLSNDYLQMSTTAAIPDPLGATLQNFPDNVRTFHARHPVGIQLHLAGNNLSGTSLPARCFGQSSSGNYSEVLDLSNNSVKWEILGDVFNGTCLQRLKFLNLSNNELTGPVPQSIVILPNLIVLDASSNNLPGPLPFIQTSSPFFDRKIFANNPGLCGDPLPRVVLIITLVSMVGVVGSCAVSTWRWRVYQQRHQQDSDLIKTLMQRESPSLMPLGELKRARDKRGNDGLSETKFSPCLAIKRSKCKRSETEKKDF